MKRLQKIISIGAIAFLGIAVGFAALPSHKVKAATTYYCVMGQATITDGSGTCSGSPLDLPPGGNTVTILTTGTFTIFLASGTTGTASSGTGTVVSGSPVALSAGSNTITTTGTSGTITVQINAGTAANWSSANTWSLASGGLAGAGVPTSVDDVKFDSASFSGGSMVLTVDAAAACNNMNWTGATNSPTFAHTGFSVSVYGSATFISGMSITQSGGNGETFISTSGSNTLTTGGVDCKYLTFAGAGGSWTFQDNVTATTGITFSAGTLNTNGKTLALGIFNISGAAAKTLTLGASSITCTSYWGNATASNISFTANTATINVAGDFRGMGLTAYNSVTLNGATSTITGANTFANLSFVYPSGAQTITLPASTTQTVSGTFTATGQTTSNRCTIQSSSAGTSATINAASVAVTKSDIKDLIGAGAGSWAMGATSDVRKVSGGSGITFRAFWSSGTGNWSAYGTKWATTSGGSTYLLAATDSVTNVYFDALSFTAGSQTVTVDSTATCLSMDWTGATNSPTLAFGNIKLSPYGDVTFISTLTITSGTGELTWLGSSTSCKFTSGSASIAVRWGTDGGFTGKVTLQDNISGTKLCSIGKGTLDTNNKNITCATFEAWGNPITLTLGSSTINCTSTNLVGTITLTANTSTINCSGNFSSNSLTGYNIVNLTGTTSTITGSNTFAQLNLVAGTTQTITFTDGTTQTATTFGLSGSAGHVHTLQGSGAAGWNLTRTGTGYANLDYLSISRSAASPAVNIFYAGTHSTNGGNNTGWNFYAPDVPTVTQQAATGVHPFDTTANGTITNLGAGNINATAIVVQWGFSTGVYHETYNVGGSYPLGAFSDVVDDLHPGTTIFMRVGATNSVGTGYSSEITFAVPNIGAPTNFAVSSNGVLTWTNGTYAKDTWIVRGTSANPTTTTDGAVIFQTTGTTLTDQNPNPDSVTYYYSAWGYHDGIPDDGDGDSDVFYSVTYVTAQNGGAAVAAIGNATWFLGLAVLAVLLLGGGYIAKKPILAMISSAFWLFAGLYAFSLSAKNWASWDIYLGMAFVCLMFVIVGMFAPVVLREKEDKNEYAVESDQQKFWRDWNEMNNGLNMFNRQPPSEPKLISPSEAKKKIQNL